MKINAIKIMNSVFEWSLVVIGLLGLSILIKVLWLVLLTGSFM